MAEKEYIRLARPRLRSGFHIAAAARSSLWLGKDHLLCVETNGYTETYKRFYFRDIQVVTLHRTKRYLISSILWAIPTVLFAIIASFIWLEVSRQAASRGDIIGASGVSALALIFAFALVGNYLAGPTCVCKLRTAVQEEEIPALKRVKQVQKIMARIRPLITETQGLLPREEIPARLEALATQNQPRLVVDDPNLPPRMVG